MAIIVDKVKKRRDIALTCKELFYQNGIKDLTVAQVAKSAGVGKGTIYDYFSNKEDIVLEITEILIEEHNMEKREKIDKKSTTKEKIKCFFEFFYLDEYVNLRYIYKEFVSISLVSKDIKMEAFHKKNCEYFFNWFESIIQSGIEKKELKPTASKLSYGLYALGDGMFLINSVANNTNDLKYYFDTHIDAIFELIEEEEK